MSSSCYLLSCLKSHISSRIIAYQLLAAIHCAAVLASHGGASILVFLHLIVFIDNLSRLFALMLRRYPRPLSKYDQCKPLVLLVRLRSKIPLLLSRNFFWCSHPLCDPEILPFCVYSKLYCLSTISARSWFSMSTDIFPLFIIHCDS